MEFHKWPLSISSQSNESMKKAQKNLSRFYVAIKSYVKKLPNSNEHWLLFTSNCLKEVLCLTCNCLKEVIGTALIRKPRSVDWLLCLHHLSYWFFKFLSLRRYSPTIKINIKNVLCCIRVSFTEVERGMEQLVMGVCVGTLVSINVSLRDYLKISWRLQKTCPRLNVDQIEPLVLGFDITHNTDALKLTCWTGDIIWEQQAW